MCVFQIMFNSSQSYYFLLPVKNMRYETLTAEYGNYLQGKPQLKYVELSPDMACGVGIPLQKLFFNQQEYGDRPLWDHVQD